MEAKSDFATISLFRFDYNLVTSLEKVKFRKERNWRKEKKASVTERASFFVLFCKKTTGVKYWPSILFFRSSFSQCDSSIPYTTFLVQMREFGNEIVAGVWTIGPLEFSEECFLFLASLKGAWSFPFLRSPLTMEVHGCGSIYSRITSGICCECTRRGILVIYTSVAISLSLFGRGLMLVGHRP